MSADNHNDPLTLNRLAAAIATLKQLGYTYHGGEQWKPPIGKKPDFDQIDALRVHNSNLMEQREIDIKRLGALRAENERLLATVNDWIYANGPNGWIDALRVENERLCEACASGWGEPALVNVLRAEVDALRTDAERYRWLRTRKGLSLTSDGSKWTRQDGSTFINTHRLCEGGTQHAAVEGLDAAIDAARAAKGQG